MNTPAAASAKTFSPYQKRVLGILAFLQFSVILDFMLMAPLGALIIPALKIGPSQFGLVVSAYAFSAGISGILIAGFADRFDRKKLLLFFYSGFVLGTVWCGLAQSYESLLLARVFTGLFGGVIGSVVLAIAADLFAPQMRGRVMGLIQTAFSASQVLGIPAGLYLSSRWNWHVPFLAMAALGLAGGIVVALGLKPVTGHLNSPQERSAFLHLLHTLKDPRHVPAFAATALLTTGAFMLMPFSSAFATNNLEIGIAVLPVVYLVTGLCMVVFGPVIGKATDTFGKRRVFSFGTVMSIVMVLIYTHLGPIPLYGLILLNIVLFVGISSRMIPFQAMASTIPVPAARGAFNAVSASIQQVSGGIASVIAGHIVSLDASGKLLHFNVVGYVVAGTALVAWALFLRLGASRGTP
ncbi:MFS transporter [Robbsia sp. KACC 23696]|uniref:MFS transporter n=1 Tax=Robbsia sp. KACC 23696 TaxID=3149231 RepID=UPI00325ADDBF